MRRPASQIIVIFGASGDLTKRKLLPSLLGLYLRKLLPEKFRILCAARTPMATERFRASRLAEMRGSSVAGASEPEAEKFFSFVDYLCFDTADPSAYGKLAAHVLAARGEYGIDDNILFYLSTPPSMYPFVADGISACGLSKSGDGKKRRIVVEKPFGRDLDSAQKLNAKLLSIFDETEIFRIDHYLGKETVQNILVLRFANGIFEPLWNGNYVDSVEISAFETLGVENRGSYYEAAGAVRDMVQNHLLGLMSFVAMECPPAFDSESIRGETAKVLRSLRPISDGDLKKNIFRGQYRRGIVGGKPVPAYVEEMGVAPNSTVETYAAMKIFVDNPRWAGVPFYIYTGKRLSRKRSEIVVNFKATAHEAFKGQCSGSSCNRLVIRIQPDEGVSLKFALKVPGKGFEITQVPMDFNYSSLEDVSLPRAYERLLLDAMCADSTLFARSDIVELGWKFIDPVLKCWKSAGAEGLAFYDSGSDGTVDGVNMMLEHSGEFCSLPITNELSAPIGGSGKEK